MKPILTTCPYCGVGCNLYLRVTGKRVVGVIPSRFHPLAKGGLCVKGWNVHEFIHDPARLVHPLIRGKAGFSKASWRMAIGLAVERLRDAIAKYGPDAVACLSSSKCTNEENFLMQKFARCAIGTNNVDNCARLCHSSTIVGLIKAFGEGAMTNSIEEIEGARVVFVVGSNTTEEHPLIARRILTAIEKGAKLLLADPRGIELSRFATVHARLRPGTDVALLNGMMNVIIAEGLHDKAFVETRTENFEALRRTVERYPPEVSAEITGVPAAKIVAMARIFASSRRSTILYAMGVTQHTTGVDNVLSIANLAMLTGNVGRKSSGISPLRGHQNVQGACDVGALPNLYPGYQLVSDSEAKAKLEWVWGVRLPEKPGLTVTEMMDAALEGRVKAMYIMGENPVLSDPNSSRVEKALSNLEFLLVQDIFMTETAKLAHVILPAACFAEKEGTFTNTERRVQRVRKAIPPPGRAKADWEILPLLSTRMGYPMRYTSPSEIMDEVARITPIYAGISYDRLEGFGLQWPCTDRDHPGTRFLHRRRFSRGRGLFNAVDYAPPAEPASPQFPFALITGRLLSQFHTGTMTRRSPTLEREAPECQVEMNPKDAISLNVRTGQFVRVTSRRGSIRARALVTDVIDEKTIFVPFHYAEAAANILTNPALDPASKIPEYKVCAVKIERCD